MEPDHIRYAPATGNGHDFLYTQVSFTPAPQRDHILHTAAEQRSDDFWFQKEPWVLEDCISLVASRHLQGQTGMNAYITGRDGETARVVTLVPTPLAERSSFESQTYLQTSEMRPLTAAQLNRLPELTARLREIVPDNQQPHLEDLARNVAQDIPSRTDLIRAYQRTSVTEVLAKYDARTAPPPGIDNLPASIKVARLNFPKHPGSAVTIAAAGNPAGQQTGPVPRTFLSPEPDHGFSR
ncbi:hypothetical protein ACIP9X_14900 [Arthrobacter sp. NPDC093125]|uniref:hypothetical protein n=1 Tax=Arthrobacter sp. NPDC093125 TaxID=3363944 RepID=UPI003812E753